MFFPPLKQVIYPALIIKQFERGTEGVNIKGMSLMLLRANGTINISKFPDYSGG
jgi:hypothetical protein